MAYNNSNPPGQTLIEFALILPLLLLLFVGAMDIGRYILTRLQLQDAATSAAAYGSICPDVITIIQRARRIPGSLATCEIIQGEAVTGCGAIAPQMGDQIRVYVWLGFTVTTPFVGSILGQLAVAQAESIQTVLWPAVAAVGCEVSP